MKYSLKSQRRRNQKILSRKSLAQYLHLLVVSRSRFFWVHDIIACWCFREVYAFLVSIYGRNNVWDVTLFDLHLPSVQGFGINQYKWKSRTITYLILEQSGASLSLHLLSRAPWWYYAGFLQIFELLVTCGRWGREVWVISPSPSHQPRFHRDILVSFWLVWFAWFCVWTCNSKSS